MIAKGDYPYELHIPLPFSLISNQADTNELAILPGYWFLYNLYALARNSEKYKARDQRIDRSIYLEYDYLAPDTINELFDGLSLLKEATGRAYATATQQKLSEKQSLKKGEWLLENNTAYVDELTILATGLENSKRKVKILKTSQAYHTYKRIIIFFAIQQLLDAVESDHLPFKTIQSLLLQAKGKRTAFKNIGGQLIPEQSLNQLVKKIKSGVLKGWDDIHAWYRQQSLLYPSQKRTHALASLWEITRLTRSQLNSRTLSHLVQEAMATNQWIEEQLVASRNKDYQNPFRKLVYDSDQEMNQVMGTLADNPFIAQHRKKTMQFEKRAKALLAILGTKG